jgi:dipeptidyl aminopeptidase/acylaminoacyl peptidase
MANQSTTNPYPKKKQPAWKIILWVILGLIGLSVILFLAVGVVAATQLTLPQRVFNPSANPGTIGLDYEEVTFPARSGDATIAAWYIPSEKNQQAVILVHGRDDSRTKAFAGHFIEFAKAFHEKGISVLMIDLRGHGESSDARYTFGIKERRDVLGAVDWLETRGFQPGRIGAFGYSLGAAAVIGAAAEEKDIGAVAVDSAFTEILPVIELNLESATGLPTIFVYPTLWMTRLLFGYDLASSRPINEITKIPPRPLMLIHCDTDKMIPISNMYGLLKVVPGTPSWVIHGCEHALAYREVENRPEYDRRLTEFFGSSLK